MPLLQKLIEADGAPYSAAARSHRSMMWLYAAGAVLAFLLALAGFTGRVSGRTALLGTGLSLAFVGLAGYHGLQVRRQLLEERDRSARQALTVMLAAQLRDRDEAELHETVRRGGPAGHAAQLILQGRKERAARNG